MSASCHGRQGPRPAWGTLYAGLAVALGGAAIAEVFLPTGPLRMVVNAGGAITAFALLKIWVVANRTALAAVTTCCTTRVTIRVAHPGAVAPLPAPTPRPAVAEDPAPLEHEVLV